MDVWACGVEGGFGSVTGVTGGGVTGGGGVGVTGGVGVGFGVTTGAGGAAGTLAPGISEAALGMFSRPTVMPVTGS